jgi:hypothetical protein
MSFRVSVKCDFLGCCEELELSQASIEEAIKNRQKYQVWHDIGEKHCCHSCFVAVTAELHKSLTRKPSLVELETEIAKYLR